MFKAGTNFKHGFLFSPSLNALGEVNNDSDLNVHFGKIQVLKIE